jgi:hypothetical protein
MNKFNSKFSVNGKLCVLLFGRGPKCVAIRYSQGLTSEEDEDFKKHLKVLDLI